MASDYIVMLPRFFWLVRSSAVLNFVLLDHLGFYLEMLRPKLRSFDLNKCSNPDSTSVVCLDQSKDASSDSPRGFKPMSDTSSLVYLLAAELARQAHALFGTRVKSPKTHFDFMY